MCADSSVEAPPSFKPAKKYADLSGLPVSVLRFQCKIVQCQIFTNFIEGYCCRACSCNQYSRCSDWVIAGHYQSIIPTSWLRTCKNKVKIHMLNYLLTSKVWSWQKNLKPWPCCNDLTITLPIQQDLSLRLSGKAVPHSCLMSSYYLIKNKRICLCTNRSSCLHVIMKKKMKHIFVNLFWCWIVLVVKIK